MDWTPVCPYARKQEGATPGDGGVICSVMEEDAKRADPILEGAPVGVFIRVREDPSTIANLCAGTGEPILDPDNPPPREFGKGHHTGCPIFCAGREIEQAQKAMERAFKAPDRDAHDGSVGGVADIGGLDVTADDLRRAGL
jgi:hypothetical protein